MPFSPEEKVSIRHHLGYINVQTAATFVMGTPAGVETQFLIESAMDKVLPAAETRVRQYVALCDAVETQIAENQELLAVTQVGEIGVRQDEFEQLMKRYQWLRNALANLLGIYPNPFDKRFAAQGVNVPVRG